VAKARAQRVPLQHALDGPAAAAKESIDPEFKAALQALYEKEAGAKALGDKAKGILVFPNVRKAGFVVSGQHGDGAMLKKGKIADYYSSSAVGVGLEAGAHGLGAGGERRVRGLGRRGGRRLGGLPRRHLRLRIRPEGADGRGQPAGHEDHQDGLRGKIAIPAAAGYSRRE
jgi:hypothetical protein